MHKSLSQETAKNSSEHSTKGAENYCEVPKSEGHSRLDNFLLRRFNHLKHSNIHKLIRSGQVRINGKRAKSATRLCEQDLIRFPPWLINSQKPQLTKPIRQEDKLAFLKTLIFEDDQILLVNKPPGIASHAGSTIAYGMAEVAQAIYGKETFLVHRLDRETSGLLLLAKNRQAAQFLQQNWHTESFQKTYQLLVLGNWQAQNQVVECPVSTDKQNSGEAKKTRVDKHGKLSKTRFSTIYSNTTYSLLEAELHTGRTHQIRVHAALQGHPVVGDTQYGGKKAARPKWAKRELFLQATKLAFVQPKTFEVMEFECSQDWLGSLKSSCTG